MKAEAFLSRCDKVRPTGDGTWIACCPAHDDKTPSMTVRELQDGRVLLHCFSGCGVEQILASVGLDFDALFPERCVGAAAVARLRRPFPASDVLEALAGEAMLLMVVTSDIKRGECPSQETIDRALLANQRIQDAVDYALGKC